MNTVLPQGPFGPETSSTQDPTTSPSALGHGQRVAVVGGSGFYGRHLVADLLRFTGAQVLVVSRRAPQRLTTTDRVVPIACDPRDPRALREAIRGSTVVVHWLTAHHSPLLGRREQENRRSTWRSRPTRSPGDG